MIQNGGLWLGMAVALGIGLLIGVERERRKGAGPARAAAGIRTFALVSLLGAASSAVGDELLLAAAAIGVAALATVAYWRSRDKDPGLTTEAAMLLTLMLGGLSVREPALAAGLGVAVAVLLAARGVIHHFVRHVLTEAELHNGLVLAAAALVIYPLIPDGPVGPFGVIQPRTIWGIVLVVLLISAAGHVALRTLGPRFGLPVAGFVGGFVSSTATIAAMGAHSRRHAGQLPPAVAGAVLSTAATLVQLVAVLAVTSPAALMALRVPLVLWALVACIYGAAFAWRGIRQAPSVPGEPGRAFGLGAALGFAALVGATQLLSGVLEQRYGAGGMLAASAVAGLADLHAAAASVAALVASGRITADAATIPVLVGLTANCAIRAVVAVTAGGWRFAMPVIAGLALMLAAAWTGAILRP